MQYSYLYMTARINRRGKFPQISLKFWLWCDWEWSRWHAKSQNVSGNNLLYPRWMSKKKSKFYKSKLLSIHGI